MAKKIKDGPTILGLLDRGELMAKFVNLNEETLRKLREQAGPKGKAKGSITLKLNMEVQGSSVQIESVLEAKTPKEKGSTTMMFVTDQGELSTEHPEQLGMFDGPRDIDRRFGG